MSTTFAAATKALAADPELLAKVSKASSPEERAAHFRAAGVEVPTHADVNAHLANMAGVAGGTASPASQAEQVGEGMAGAAIPIAAVTASAGAAAA